MIVSEYRGLTVREIAEIRKALRKQDVSYRVVKNRLMRIAAEGPVGEALGPLLDRSDGDRLRDRRGGHGQGRPRRRQARTRSSRSPAPCSATASIDADGVERLAALPGREVLLAELAGAFAAPMATTAGLIAAPLRDVAGLFGALHDQKASAA